MLGPACPPPVVLAPRARRPPQSPAFPPSCTAAARVSTPCRPCARPRAPAAVVVRGPHASAPGRPCSGPACPPPGVLAPAGIGGPLPSARRPRARPPLAVRVPARAPKALWIHSVGRPCACVGPVRPPPRVGPRPSLRRARRPWSPGASAPEGRGRVSLRPPSRGQAGGAAPSGWGSVRLCRGAPRTLAPPSAASRGPCAPPAALRGGALRRSPPHHRGPPRRRPEGDAHQGGDLPGCGPRQRRNWWLGEGDAGVGSSSCLAVASTGMRTWFLRGEMSQLGY